jgi:hypothetical protein
MSLQGPAAKFNLTHRFGQSSRQWKDECRSCKVRLLTKLYRLQNHLTLEKNTSYRIHENPLIFTTTQWPSGCPLAAQLIKGFEGNRREKYMHIHSTPLNNQMALGSTQAAQQAMETRKAAAEVRRKLTSLGNAAAEEETVSRVDARAEADPNRRRSPQRDDEPFRSVFFSASA